MPAATPSLSLYDEEFLAELQAGRRVVLKTSEYSDVPVPIELILKGGSLDIYQSYHELLF